MSRRRPGTPVILDARDEELLELAALQVPWFMVCGELHARYGSAGLLARRLMEMVHEGLLELRSGPGEPMPDARTLEADAVEQDCYRDLERTRDPRWTITATDRGMALIAHRLGRE